MEQSSSFTFVLQAQPESREAWGQLATTAEAAGYAALVVPDHPGLTHSPFVALAAVAAPTSTLQLGTAVINCGVRNPLDVAADVATLDVLSDGRALLGLGAGHTPSEWSTLGLDYPSPAERIARLAEFTDVVPALLAGDSVTYASRHVSLTGASLHVQPHGRVPLLIGGNNARLLTLAARRADIVELSGTGKTLPDGHRHQARWSEEDIDRAVGIVKAAAQKEGRDPVMSALVQSVVITDDAERATNEWLVAGSRSVPPELLPSVADALAAPYTLIGTVSEIITKIHRLGDRWGFARYTIRDTTAGANVLEAANAV